MSLIERALRKFKSPGDSTPLALGPERPVVEHGMRSCDGEGVDTLEPMAPGIATLQAAEGDATRLAWDLQGSSVLFSQLRNIRREIAALLDGHALKRRGTIIMVASALPGEGKSFLSVGLARVFAAEQDRRVILVDADIAKRQLTELLGTSTRPGLIECLANGRPVSEVLCRSDHPEISFMPAGQWRSDAPDLLCSKNMDRILESFRHCDARHVFVVDTAPILALGETTYLAELADLVVLVIRANRTPRAAADEALRKLAADRPLAAVLNGQQASILDGYYGFQDCYGEYLPRQEK